MKDEEMNLSICCKELKENYLQLRKELNISNFKINEKISSILSTNNNLQCFIKNELIAILNIKPYVFKIVHYNIETNSIYVQMKEYLNENKLRNLELYLKYIEKVLDEQELCNTSPKIFYIENGVAVIGFEL